MNYNKTILGGHLTRDPELRQAQNDTTLCKFGVAINRKRGEREETCFVDLVAFGRTAEVIAEHFRKGDPILVEGRLSYSTWVAHDDTKRSKHEVIVETFSFVGGKQRADASKQDVPF